MAIKTDDITPSFDPQEERLVTAAASTDDNALERALRPKQLEEYVGQKKATNAANANAKHPTATYHARLDGSAVTSTSFKSTAPLQASGQHAPNSNPSDSVALRIGAQPHLWRSNPSSAAK